MDYTFFFYKNTWFQFQPAVSYFSVYFQPKVFLILFLIFVFEFNGSINYFNKKLEEYKVTFTDDSIDYNKKNYIDGVEIILLQ